MKVQDIFLVNALKAPTKCASILSIKRAKKLGNGTTLVLKICLFAGKQFLFGK